MRRRNWRHILDDRAVLGPLLVVGVLVVGFVLPKACDGGRDAVVGYRMTQLAEPIERHARAAGLDLALVKAVVIAESSGDPEASSSAQAKGLMQITPVTHTDAMQRFDLPEGDLFEVDYNLQVGTRYLAYLLERFDGDRTLALAAYHMGPTRVSKLRREHAQLSSQELVQRHAGPKTRAYVKRVLSEADP